MEASLMGATIGAGLAVLYIIADQVLERQRRAAGYRPSPQAEALYQQIEERHQRIAALLDNLPTARRKRELLETGQKAADAGQWDEAIAAWEECLALELDTEWRAELSNALATAYYNRGNTKREVGQHQKAIADYDRTINLNPSNAAAYNNRGVAKADLGQYQDAIANFNKAIALNPNYAVAYNNQGASKMELGQYKEAIVDYDRAINFNSSYAAAYYNRGVANYKLGQHQQAVANYDRAIDLNPNDAAACNDRGVARAELGQNNEALTDFNQALELFEAAGDEQKVEIARRNRESLAAADGRPAEAISEPVMMPSQQELALAA